MTQLQMRKNKVLVFFDSFSHFIWTEQSKMKHFALTMMKIVYIVEKIWDAENVPLLTLMAVCVCTPWQRVNPSKVRFYLRGAWDLTVEGLLDDLSFAG